MLTTKGAASSLQPPAFPYDNLRDRHPFSIYYCSTILGTGNPRYYSRGCYLLLKVRVRQPLDN